MTNEKQCSPTFIENHHKWRKREITTKEFFNLEKDTISNIHSIVEKMEAEKISRDIYKIIDYIKNGSKAV